MPIMLQPGWLGRRVTVRRTLPAAPSDAPSDATTDGSATVGGPARRARFGDVVGVLLHLDGDHAVIDTRRGLVEVALAGVTIAKPAPPSTADELALEVAAAAGWRARETEHLGGWLLRADGGFTGRANSVLPLRAPGRPLEQALDAARAGYTRRGLPLRLRVPTEARRLLDAELGDGTGYLAPEQAALLLRLAGRVREAQDAEPSAAADGGGM